MVHNILQHLRKLDTKIEIIFDPALKAMPPTPQRLCLRHIMKPTLKILTFDDYCLCFLKVIYLKKVLLVRPSGY